jgi:hypothetical protein
MPPKSLWSQRDAVTHVAHRGLTWNRYLIDILNEKIDQHDIAKYIGVSTRT